MTLVPVLFRNAAAFSSYGITIVDKDAFWQNHGHWFDLKCVFKTI